MCIWGPRGTLSTPASAINSLSTLRICANGDGVAVVTDPGMLRGRCRSFRKPTHVLSARLRAVRASDNCLEMPDTRQGRVAGFADARQRQVVERGGAALLVGLVYAAALSAVVAG